MTQTPPDPSGRADAPGGSTPAGAGSDPWPAPRAAYPGTTRPPATQGGGSRTVLILLVVLFLGPCLLGLGGALFVGALRGDQTTSGTEPTWQVNERPEPRVRVTLGDLRVGQCVRDTRLSPSRPVRSCDSAVVVRCSSGPAVFEVVALTPGADSAKSALAACAAEAGSGLRVRDVYAYRGDGVDACLTRGAAD